MSLGQSRFHKDSQFYITNCGEIEIDSPQGTKRTKFGQGKGMIQPLLTVLPDGGLRMSDDGNVLWEKKWQGKGEYRLELVDSQLLFMSGGQTLASIL
jgi:hypothetical protein